jgi:hypothetical protein
MSETEQLRAALADALQQIMDAANARIQAVVQLKNTIAELEKALAKEKETKQVSAVKVDSK